jgi:hypothetical protein
MESARARLEGSITVTENKSKRTMGMEMGVGPSRLPWVVVRDGEMKVGELS